MSKLKLPTNLAYSRSITPSAAAMYSFNSETPKNKNLLNIAEVTAVGTISNYKDIHKDGGKNIENSNPQTIDTCYLPLEHDSLAMQFTVAFSAESQAPHSCNDVEFRNALTQLTQNYAKISGYTYLAERYLDNIFTAKMLWRNGLADDVNVSVTALRSELPTITSPEQEAYKDLIKAVGLALSGEGKRIVLKVEITGWLGNGQEVFPSQEFVEKGSGKGAKSKTLARITIQDNQNVAAMHSQKIGNAIRQIDTWYEGFDTLQKALPIDPACVNKSEFKAYRLKNTRRDLFSLFENNLVTFSNETEQAKNPEELNPDVHFVIANLIRGGVFGGK